MAAGQGVEIVDEVSLRHEAAMQRGFNDRERVIELVVPRAVE
jgi:hypothetical protein